MKILNGSYSQQFSKNLQIILLSKHITDSLASCFNEETSKNVSWWYQNSEAFDTFFIIWAISKFYEISSI